MQLHSYSDAHLLIDDLAEQIKNILCDAIGHRDQAYLVVSGGKTPIDLFKALARMNIPWGKVVITLADERCVPIDNADRNERTVHLYLLQHHASNAHFVRLYDETQSIEEIEEKIASLPKFDAVILGMGEDGHTASLFPCANELKNGLDDHAAAVLLVNPQKAPHQRLSLSKRRLLNSQKIFLHLVGQKKLAVLHQAMAEHDPRVMPVCAFINNPDANIQVMYAP